MFKYKSQVQKRDNPYDRVQSPRVMKLSETVYDIAIRQVHRSTRIITKRALHEIAMDSDNCVDVK